MNPDLLGLELGRLVEALAPHEIPVIIGGGYGLLLRQRHVEAEGLRTLRPIPEARATSDLDVFLSLEIVTDARRMDTLRDTLHALGYHAVDRARYYQFERAVEYAGRPQTLKIDLLAPPPPPASALRRQVKIKGRRIRPLDAEEIHAHATPEAFTVAEKPLLLKIGEAGQRVLVPHPYSYLLLKLFACRDQLHRQREAGAADDRQDADQRARYHAFDLYRIIAMMTAPEVAEAEAFRDTYADDETVSEARHAVATLFASADAPGSLAVMRHTRQVGLSLSKAQLTAFIEDLHLFFPPLSSLT